MSAHIAAVTSANVRPPVRRGGINSGQISGSTNTYGPEATVRTTGDLLLAGVVFATGGTNGATMATPTGWTLLNPGGIPIDSAGTGNNSRGYTFSRVADGTATDTPTWTKTGTTGNWSVQTEVWKSAGVDVIASNSLNGAADTSPILPSVTPTVIGTTLVAFVMSGTTANVTAAARWTEVADGGGGGRQQVSWHAAGVTAASPTPTFALSAAGKWVTFVIAIKRKV